MALLRKHIIPALLWAATGAGLFFGVGAALPIWHTPPEQISGPPFKGEEWLGQQGNLWFVATVAAELPPPMRDRWGPCLVTGAIGLLVVGAVAGLLCRLGLILADAVTRADAARDRMEH